MMAFEVACWQCSGRLKVETAGVVVACPHCGAHLQIPAPTAPAPQQVVENVVVPNPSVSVEAPAVVVPPQETTIEAFSASQPEVETPAPVFTPPVESPVVETPPIEPLAVEPAAIVPEPSQPEANDAPDFSSLGQVNPAPVDAAPTFPESPQTEQPMFPGLPTNEPAVEEVSEAEPAQDSTVQEPEAPMFAGLPTGTESPEIPAVEVTAPVVFENTVSEPTAETPPEIAPIDAVPSEENALPTEQVPHFIASEINVAETSEAVAPEFPAPVFEAPAEVPSPIVPTGASTVSEAPLFPGLPGSEEPAETPEEIVESVEQTVSEEVVSEEIAEAVPQADDVAAETTEVEQQFVAPLVVEPDAPVVAATEVPTVAEAVEPPAEALSFPGPPADSVVAEAIVAPVDSIQPATEAPVTPAEVPAFAPTVEPVAAAVPVVEVVQPVMAQEVQLAEPVAATPVGTVDPAPAATTKKQGKGLFLLLLISYASAVTLALVYLIIKLRSGDPHDLESLPDLEPPVRNGEIALKLAPQNAPMAPGHTLKLGEERRFGNLLITPLKVTKEPIDFVHYKDTETRKRPSTKPVLKLWIRFKNVSEDQTFAPLGQKLLLTRVQDKDDYDLFRANNFVCNRGDKADIKKAVLVFDMPINASEWDLKGQNIDRVLKPGEVLETYLPTNENGIGQLQDGLLWRIQFRKGYHPKSKRGVTTLIEVAFDSNQIQGGA